jgi:hypothetical protein
MLKHGELFDDYSPDFSLFYAAISIFYNHPKMEVLKIDNGFVMYGCKLKCLLEIKRYLFAVVKDDNTVSLGDVLSLGDLQWEALHIKELPDVIVFKNKDHEYNPQRIIYLDHPIVRTEINDDESIYSCDYHKDIKIKLIHKDKNSRTQYQETGNLLSALETFMTVISFKL